MRFWYYLYVYGFETFITDSLDEALNIAAGLQIVGQSYQLRSLVTDERGEPAYLERTDYDME